MRKRVDLDPTTPTVEIPYNNDKSDRKKEESDSQTNGPPIPNGSPTTAPKYVTNTFSNIFTNNKNKYFINWIGNGIFNWIYFIWNTIL